MSKVSVALATFNGEKYIAKQLHSLLFQRRTIDEVIIVDDASTDKTADIIRDFIEKNQLLNWHIYINEKNIGFLKNFKSAIEETTGDVIFLCDQDDIWCKTKVDSMLNRFESDERIKAIYSGFKIIDETDNVINSRQKMLHSNNNLIKFRVEPFETVKIDLSTICKYNISPGCTLAFTREVKDIYLEKTKSICVHDWEIALIAAFLDGLYFFNTPLTHYRIHSGNTIGLSELAQKSDKRKLAMYDLRLKKAQKIKDYIKSMDVYYYLLSDDKVKILTNSTNFAEKRLNALLEKKFCKIFELYKDFDIYTKSVTLKGRLADIFCVLKK